MRRTAEITNVPVKKLIEFTATSKSILIFFTKIDEEKPDNQYTKLQVEEIISEYYNTKDSVAQIVKNIALR